MKYKIMKDVGSLTGSVSFPLLTEPFVDDDPDSTPFSTVMTNVGKEKTRIIATYPAENIPASERNRRVVHHNAYITTACSRGGYSDTT